jgi:cysteinyl-tRNA synthetase
VNYWLHGEFLLDNSGKMSKSKGEFLTLGLLIDKGYDPMDYRYFCLGGHYRSQLKFSFESLDTAHTARSNMFDRVVLLKKEGAKKIELASETAKGYAATFDEHINNDMNTPRGLADLWGVLKDDSLSVDEKYTLVLYFDELFGFNLADLAIPEEVVVDDREALALLEQRTQAKKEKNWSLADTLRKQLDVLGFLVKDTASGSTLEKKM